MATVKQVADAINLDNELREDFLILLESQNWDLDKTWDLFINSQYIIHRIKNLSKCIQTSKGLVELF